MDKYTSKTLPQNDHILYQGVVHWIVFLPGLVHVIGGMVMMLIIPWLGLPRHFVYVGLGLAGLGLLGLVRAFIVKYTTELVCTRRLIIAKTGFIARNTVELDANRIEGIRVHQSILGRFLNYGSVIVRGIGGMETHVTHICNPLAFRKASQAINEERLSRLSDEKRQSNQRNSGD